MNMNKKVFIGLSVIFILAALFTACKMAEDLVPTYTVVFDANGGTGNMAEQTLNYGMSQRLNSIADIGFTHDLGYEFVGWAETPSGDVIYTDKQIVTNLTETESKTLFARWGWNIEFRTSPGSYIADKYVFPGSKVTQPQNPPTRSGGWVFEGWYSTDPQIYQSAKLYDFELVVEGHLILYAKWVDPTSLLDNSIEFTAAGPFSIGYNETLSNTIKPGLSTGIISYASSNTNVATVDSASGLVTAKLEGSTTITATQAPDTKYKQATAQYTLNVTVVKAPTPNPPRLASTSEDPPSITLEPPLYANPNFTLQYARSTENTAPVTGWQYSESFTSLDKNVEYYFFARYAAVSGKNTVSDVSSSVKFTTTSGLQPRTIEFETKGTISKTYGNAPFTNPVMTGSPGAGTISYSSGTPEVATVNPGTGLVTILKAGTTVITATKVSDGTYIQATAEYTLNVSMVTPGKPNPPQHISSTINTVTLGVPDGADTVLFALQYAYSETAIAPAQSSSDWQDGKTISNLKGDTRYYFFARYKAAAEKNNVSAASDGVEASTSPLLSRAIEFETIGLISKTYGDDPFTNAVKSGSSGGGEISYSCDPPGVVTVDSGTGKVTLIKQGSTVITAIKASDGTYVQAQAQYFLAVSIGTPAAPGAPEPGPNTVNSVTLNEPKGAKTNLYALQYAYSSSDSTDSLTWQDGKTFGGLQANTSYFFFARYKAAEGKNSASGPSIPLQASTNSLLDRNIEFITSGTIQKTYGDTAFTNTLKPVSVGAGAISYSSGTPTVATVNSTSGLVTILKAGTTVITGGIESDGTYAAKTTTYTLQVDIASPAAPGAPTNDTSKMTQTSITLVKPSGANDLFPLEYVRVAGTVTTAPATGWQDELTFGGLAANTSYRFFARYKAVTDKNNVSPASPYVTITTSILLSNTIAFTTTGTITLTYGQTLAANPLSNTGLGSGTISYSSSNEGLATVNSSGVVTLNKQTGTTTITATKASDGIYAVATASYSITVNKKSVTISTPSVTSSKVYDGYTTATITGVATTTDFIAGDTVSIQTGNANFNTKDVGTGKTISFTGFDLAGSHAGNYNLTGQPVSVTGASITKKDATISSVTATSRVYDGTDKVDSTGGTISGLVSGESFTISRGTGTLSEGKNIGTNKIVIFSGFGLTGTGNGNYNVIQPPNSTANITAKSITLTATAPAALNPMDGLSATFSVYSSGFVSGDTPTLTVELASNSYGLSLTNNSGVNLSSKSVTINYNGTSAVAQTAAFSQSLTSTNNSNYSVSGTVSVTVYDGQAATRAISVSSSNYSTFNTYANNSPGRTRHYKLTSNITLTGTTQNNWTAIGTEANPFTGSFNGQGFYISGINICKYLDGISGTLYSYQGMFGHISGSACVIQNLGLVDCRIYGLLNVGGIAGYSNGAKIQRCFVKNTGTAADIQICAMSGFSGGDQGVCGGIVGGMNGSTALVEHCYTNIPVNSYGYSVGGIAGSNKNGKVLRTYARGAIYGYGYTGGIVGEDDRNSTTHELRGNVALCSSLTCSNGRAIGRITSAFYNQDNGCAHYDVNYARSDLPLLSGSVEYSSGCDGMSAYAGTTNSYYYYNHKDFWADKGFTMGTGGWEMTTGANNYPTLQGLQGQ